MFKKKLSLFNMEMEYWIHSSERKAALVYVKGRQRSKY